MGTIRFWKDAFYTCAFTFAVAAVLPGCDNDDPNDGGVSDADTDTDSGDGGGDGGPACPDLEAWQPGGEGAGDLSLPPASGHAVAGRITAPSQLLQGLKPRGQVGDFLMANGRLAMVIEDAGPSDGYGIHGGEILDVDLIGPDGPLGESLFGEMLLGVLPEVVAADSVSVLNDGGDGNAAVVRVVGRLELMWVIDDCCSSVFTGDLGLPVALDYVLEPDAEAVELRLTVRNNTARLERPDTFLTVVIGGDGLRRYAPGVGLDEEANFGRQDYIAMVAEQVSYAWIPSHGMINYLISMSGFHLYDSPAVDLPACEDTEAVLGHFVVAQGDVSQVQAAVRRVRSEPAGTAITGTVTEADGTTPVAGARVHLTNAEGHASMARTSEEGHYRIEALAGEYEIQVWIDDRRPSTAQPLTVADAEQTVDFTMGAAGGLAWQVRDDQGELIPAKVSIIPLDEDAPSPPAHLGEATHPSGAIHHAFSLPGGSEVTLDVGRYRIVASRGYEYEYDELEVEVAEGETASVELTLVRSVDTEGWLCGDFHIHTMYSPDSNDLAEWKVAASVAVGLEVPVTTDHRWVADLQPVVVAMGLEDWVQWIPGQEVTTFSFGHFNAYPLVPRVDDPNDGAFDVMDKDPLALFQDVWDDPTDPVLQINHPRGQVGSSYFSYVELDPATLAVGEGMAGQWSPEFDAIEVFNGSDWISNRDETVQDWFGMLNAGYTTVAAGNSDSHDAEWSDVGFPRNYVFFGSVEPADVAHDDLRDGVRQGQMTVSGGLFVTTESGGARPGAVVAAASGSAVVRVRVQAPSWMDAEHLEVYVDGVAVETVELSEQTEDPENPVVRYDQELTIELAGDAWLVAAAWSEGDLAPATPGERPFGVTNPIYFDVDGDGQYRQSGRTVQE